MVDLEKVRYPWLHTHTHTPNTNTVVALAQAGNWGQSWLSVGAGLASWEQANWKSMDWYFKGFSSDLIDIVYKAMS